MSCSVTGFEVTPTSLITRAEPAMQRVNLHCQASCDAHLYLGARRGGRFIAEKTPLTVRGGANDLSVLLPLAEQEEDARFTLCDADGLVLAEAECEWACPREWTIYVMRSSHTDIGLHNSQYIQRLNSCRFVDRAMSLCDQTEPWDEASRYRYTIEGTWWWENYGDDRGEEAARKVVEDYIKTGRIAVGAATAGNHTQVYGHEQMCRSAYTRERLKQDWDIDSHTMTMIDNNGMSWPLVAAYADAGFKNIVFAPNQWNPLPSTIWPINHSTPGPQWNPEACGGGSRIDVRYDSALPMVFYWEGADDESRLLVWASTQYGMGGAGFGVTPPMGSGPFQLEMMANATSAQLGKLEKRYPYDVWMFACYNDDEEPNLKVNEAIRKWNRTWQWPQFRLVGDLDEPFDRLRETFDAQIPVLRGDITGGWYQHPLSTPELLARKFAVDRLLPTAEKLATLAGLFAPGYQYPAVEFNRAWDGLICNDEHSYGTSGYQGRRVYETWMQHRDWIEKAETVAREESERALEALAGQVTATEPSVVLFNPTLCRRRELVETEGENGRNLRFVSPEVPAFGYAVVPLAGLPEATVKTEELPTSPPTVENDFYKLSFAEDGSITSIVDKELRRELMDEAAPFRCNQFAYTNDNHKSFVTPKQAEFRILRDAFGVTVIARMEEPVSGATIEQRVTLPAHEKRIDIDNRLDHVTDVINKNRYYRYGYYAFPFSVENAEHRVQLNGCIAVPGEDQTGHGTETYMAARDWCCLENESFGVALLQLDSQLVEFGRIHPDKTDCFLGKQGSSVYSYLFNDWLQMHTPGGSHVNPRFRYTIVSYAGDGGFRKASVPQLGERICEPMMAHMIPAQKGSLPAEGMSFVSTDRPNMRLLALKRAEDGDGIVLRLQESHGVDVSGASLEQALATGAAVTACTVDECSKATALSAESFPLAKNGYLALRISGCDIPQRPEEAIIPEDGQPAPIGSVYTGLITEPRAACGEHQGHLYLIWGQNMEPDLSHYELYRSEESGFSPDDKTFLTKVEPGPYRVALHEERDLRTHTAYFYRVRAVSRRGRSGEFSNEFSGLTRE